MKSIFHNHERRNMPVYYFETEPIIDQVEFEDSFLILINPPDKKPNAKSKEDKDYNARVKIQTEGFSKSMDIIKTGHVNLHNRPIELDNIFAANNWIDGFDNYYIYYCKPTSARKSWGQHNSYRNQPLVYEFDIEREFKTKDDLILFLIKHYKYCELIAMIISKYSYSNDGYTEKLKSHIESASNVAKSLTKDIGRWNDELYWISKRITESGDTADNNLLWAIENEHVSINDKFISSDTIYNLCAHKLYKSLLAYVSKEIKEEAKIVNVSNDTKQMLMLASDRAEVKQTLNLLGLTMPKLSLTVTKESEYSDKILEKKDFETMDEVETYIVKNYDVSVSDIRENYVDQIEIRDDCGSIIRFNIEVDKK